MSTFGKPRDAWAAAIACSLIVAGCSHVRTSAVSATTTTGSATATAGSATKPTTPPPTTPAPASQGPRPVGGTFGDTPTGRPGYALVVDPGPTGSDSFGGVAVYQYQDGKQLGYFSFHGSAASGGAIALSIQGDPSGTTAMAQVTTPTTITIENCGLLFAAPVDNAVNGAAMPPAPSSCTFTEGLAPQTPPRSAVTTNLTATTAIKGALLGAYLFQTGWQSQYGSDIALHPGTTYVAYDSLTGLNWALATFDYNGAGPSGSNGPGVDMQDGGNTGYFYQIPGSGSPSSPATGWVKIGNAGTPFCISHSFVPSDVIAMWGLSDDPHCATATKTSTLVPAQATVPRGWS